MSKQVWIDLEETIINNWQDGLLLSHLPSDQIRLTDEISDYRFY